jgi:nucleoside-diphosphate-sugar epimerase
MNEKRGMALGNILVTGATGQVGRALVSALLHEGESVSVLTRVPESARDLWPDQPVAVRVGDLTEPSSLESVCDGIETVFHLASYAPRSDEPDLYNAPSHWPVTAGGTANLMARVADSSVKRLVYLSTVKAMGDQAGARGRPADETLTPAPDTLYGRAKLAAEQRVLATGQATDIQASVLRLPMVYGLDGKGNLARMIAAIAAGRFPPWPRIDNHRSAIHVADVVDAARLVARHPASDGETYCVTDGRGYSTRWIYERILLALDRPLPRWAVPWWMLQAAAAGGTLGERLLGRRLPLTLDGLAKLTGDAWYSSEKLERMLGFMPRHSLDTEIPRLVRRQADRAD